MSLIDSLTMPGMYDAGAAATQGAANGMSRQLASVRAMRYLRPMNSPAGRTPRSTQPSNPFFGAGGDDSGYSQFTYDPDANAAATSALAPYGLKPLSPDQVNPFAVLPNSGFFGSHPRLGQALEGGLFGAASTQGSNTVGEGISNVIGGVLRGQQERQHIVNNQFAAPFNQAVLFEQMKRQQIADADTQSQTKYRNAMANKADNAITDPVAGHMPVVVADGKTHQALYTKGGVVTDTGLGGPAGKTANKPGVANIARFAMARGWDVNNLTPPQAQQVNKDYEAEQMSIATGKKRNALNLTNQLPGQANAAEPKDVTMQRSILKTDMAQLGSSSYRNEVKSHLMVDKIMSPDNKGLPSVSDDEVNTVINTHKAARQKQFDDWNSNYQRQVQQNNGANPSLAVPNDASDDDDDQ